MVFLLTSATAFDLRCEARVTHRVQLQRASCCTAPLVCNLFVRASRAMEGDWIFFFVLFLILVPLYAFPGLFNVALGMLVEKLALQTGISIEVSERAFSHTAVLAESSFQA